jgi:hypothetical protein
MKNLCSLVALASLAAVTAALGQGDPFGGAGGRFLVAQEIQSSPPATTGRCSSHFAPLPGVLEAVRESPLVAPLPGVATAELDFGAAAAGPVTGSISVCYIASAGRDRAAFAVLELVTGAEHLLIEAAGDCRDVLMPLTPETLFQTCSLNVIGPHAERVRSGSLTSGGLVPKAMPAASLAPNVWTLFVVRD